MSHKLIELIVLALGTAATSMTVTKSKIFVGLREWMNAKNDWLGELFSCPYCFSHWVAFILIAIYRPIVFHSGVDPIDWIVSGFAVIALAAMFGGLIYRAYA